MLAAPQCVAHPAWVSSVQDPNSSLQHLPTFPEAPEQSTAHESVADHEYGPPEPERHEAWFWITHVSVEALQHEPVLGQGMGVHPTPCCHVPPLQPVAPLVAITHAPVRLLQQAPLEPQTVSLQVVPGRHVPLVHWYWLAYTEHELPLQQLPAVMENAFACWGWTAQVVLAPSHVPPVLEQADWRSTAHDPSVQHAPALPQEAVAHDEVSPWYTALAEAAQTEGVTRSHVPLA
jgi:hypothetical protein